MGGREEAGPDSPFTSQNSQGRGQVCFAGSDRSVKNEVHAPDVNLADPAAAQDLGDC